jgi:hypothetical protein
LPLLLPFDVRQGTMNPDHDDEKARPGEDRQDNEQDRSDPGSAADPAQNQMTERLSL